MVSLQQVIRIKITIIPMKPRNLYSLHQNGLWLFIMVIVSASFLTFIVPKTGNFPYEYQLAKPWMHEDLYAPFDIPLRKPDHIIKQEKDSIEKNIIPYLKRDKDIVKEMVSAYISDINAMQGNNIPNFQDSTLLNKLCNAGKNGLEEVYKKGILYPEFSYAPLLNTEEKSGFMIIDDNVSMASDPSMVYTLKQAYEYIGRNIRTLNNEGAAWFLKEIDFNKYLQPNLLYDEQTTFTIQKDKVKNISETQGVFPGQKLIVSKNEIINENNIRILNSLKYELGEKGTLTLSSWKLWVGNAIMISALLVCLLTFLKYANPALMQRRQMFFIFLMVIIMVSIAIICVRYNVNSLYIVPFTILPIILRNFFDARTAILTHIVVILMVAFFAPNSFEFIIMSISAGIIATYTSESIYQRSKLVAVSLYIILTYSILYLAFQALYNTHFTLETLIPITWFCVHGFLVLLTYSVIFIFERIFGFVSNLTLVELADSNQTLLRRLSGEAPGTFQHSLQVANIAEDVVRNIGGNPLLVRAGAMYHDIGKLENPEYFIENQHSGHNKHEGLDYAESAKIIIRHIKAGTELAAKHHLPVPLTDFILTHHGKSTALYFYRSYIKEHPERESDIDKFTYPGPNPSTKEQVALMMSDSIEAASRSLKEYTGESIKLLIDKIIDTQLASGLYNEAEITLREISMAKSVLQNKLMNIYHVRIEYPE